MRKALSQKVIRDMRACRKLQAEFQNEGRKCKNYSYEMWGQKGKNQNPMSCQKLERARTKMEKLGCWDYYGENEGHAPGVRMSSKMRRGLAGLR